MSGENGAVATGLYSKLVEAAKAAGSVDKKGKNTAQNYEYARAEDVIDAASKALTGAGLALIPTMGEVETLREYTTKSGGFGLMVRVEMIYKVVDPDSTESVEMRYCGTGSDAPGDKAIYKAVTGAAKYFYAGLLGIGFGADPEDESGGGVGPEATVRGTPGDPVVRLTASRQDRIIAAFKALKLPYGEINVLLGSCGVNALAENTPEALTATVAGLGEVQADALEVELRKAAQDSDATRPDLGGLDPQLLTQLKDGLRIVKPTLADEGENWLDGLNVRLGALGINALDPVKPIEEQLAALSTEDAEKLDAELQAIAEEQDNAPVDAEAEEVATDGN
ncbi:MAG TPA: ERF family protein [Solirubrobacterales bacterium]|nr:ERF family protein [Solirubrobacterales bacterium]